MKKPRTSNGIGLSTLLLVVFITLKLCKVIDWSWWWVIAPFWIPLAGLLVVAIAACTIVGAIAIYEHYKRKRLAEAASKVTRRYM